MKNLDAYMKNLYISLEGIDEELKNKLSNIDGYRITECCCGCNCKTEYCPCEPECDKCCEPECTNTLASTHQVIVTNQFGRFNCEQEIVRELDTQVTVNTLYDIHSQFSRFNFVADVKKINREPLYFGTKEYSICVSGEYVNRENGDMPAREANPSGIEQLYDVATCQNKKIYKVVNDVVETFDLDCPIVQTKINGEVQVYVIKHTGTNGKENSIKSSLEEVAKILGKLESKNEIKWAQVLDVAIDNIDDLYTFVLTFVFDADKVREQFKPEKINDQQ